MMIRRAHPQKHGRVYHRHHGINVLAQAMWVIKRFGSRTRRVSQGWLCPYCGFTPNENARLDSQGFLERLILRGKKPW